MSCDRARVFYGWWIVMVAALALFLGPPPIMVFSFGVFLKAFGQEFHSGRGAISLGFTIHNLAGALSAPLAGRLVDRFGAHVVILPSMAVFGAILLSSQLCSGKLWQLYVFYLVAGMIGSGAGPVVYGIVASHWFDRRRGLALGLMMFGLGLGAVFMPLLAQRLVAHFGWRIAYAIVGTAVLLVSLPVAAAFLKDAPEQMGLFPDGVSHIHTQAAGEGHDQGLTWREAWHNWTFWLLLCAFHSRVGKRSGMLHSYGSDAFRSGEQRWSRGIGDLGCRCSATHWQSGHRIFVGPFLRPSYRSSDI